MNETLLEYLIYGMILLSPVVLLVRQHIINRAPTYTARAVILSRRVSPARVNGKYSACWNYLVTFQLSDGETIELYCGEAEYQVLEEGLHGTLQWQNEDFREFLSDDE